MLKVVSRWSGDDVSPFLGGCDLWSFPGGFLYGLGRWSFDTVNYLFPRIKCLMLPMP